jgi:hypothetical protein
MDKYYDRLKLHASNFNSIKNSVSINFSGIMFSGTTKKQPKEI